MRHHCRTSAMLFILVSHLAPPSTRGQSCAPASRPPCSTHPAHQAVTTQLPQLPAAPPPAASCPPSDASCPSCQLLTVVSMMTQLSRAKNSAPPHTVAPHWLWSCRVQAAVQGHPPTVVQAAVQGHPPTPPRVTSLWPEMLGSRQDWPVSGR